MNYNEAVDYLLNIPRFNTKPGEPNKSGNPNLKKVMELLGNPHLSYKTIHVGGTNGKGSTSQFIKSILNAMGYSVGVFTSPHLCKINERMEISLPTEEGNMTHITDEEFLNCFEKVKSKLEEHIKNGGIGLSFFEYMFAIASVFFEYKKPDYVIYEVGLGGRMDATNLIMPQVSVITSIGLDHTEYLGDTVEEVAWEKAGIIKKNIPVVFNTGDEAADAVIEKEAAFIGAKAINVAKTDYIINENTHKTIDFSLHNSYYRYHSLKLYAGGALYQVDNAITAITVCNVLSGKDAIEDSIIRKALLDFSWPGRMEYLCDRVVLDGAHNLDAIERFVETVNRNYSGKSIHLMFAVAGDKDYRPMIEMLSGRLHIKALFVTSIASKRGISAKYIADIFKEQEDISCPIFHCDDIRVTFERAYQSVKDTDDTLFCVGSLYLIGSIKDIAKEVIK